MRAQDHPEYLLEREHLHETLAALEALIEQIGHAEPMGGDAHATLALFEHYRTEYKRLNLVRTAPYVGRLDFAPDDADQPQTYY